MAQLNEQINVRYWIRSEETEEVEERDFFETFAEEETEDIGTVKVEGLEAQHASVAQEFASALQERMEMASTSGLQYDKGGRPYITLRRTPRGHSVDDALSILDAAGL